MTNNGGVAIDKNDYDRISKDPYTWFSAARRMHFTARKILNLWQNAIDSPPIFVVNFNNPESRQAFYNYYSSKWDLFSTYLMLMGYANENITKGLDLYLKNELNDPKIQKPVYDIESLGFRDHDANLNRLKHVAKTFHICFNKDEEDAAKLAIDHVLWAGKYSIPKKAEEHDYAKIMLKDIREWQKYADVLDSLYLKLEKRLSEKL